MISNFCPKCNTELKPDLSFKGNCLQCPKCNNKFELNPQNESPLGIDDSEKENDAGIRTVFPNGEIKKTNEVVCDDYRLYYDFQGFAVQGSKGEVRFPLCRQLAIAYSVQSVFLKVSLRIISQFFILPFLFLLSGSTNNLMILGEVKNDVGMEILVLFWIAVFLFIIIIIWLINDYKNHGFHPEGALQVRIRVGGETKKFTFKKDKKKAIDFFKDVENLAQKSNL